MNVEKIKEKYKDEWLLIKITAADERDQAIEGELILHSKNRDEVYEVQMDLKGDIYITYSGELPKKGFAVAFHEWSPKG